MGTSAADVGSHDDDMAVQDDICDKCKGKDGITDDPALIGRKLKMKKNMCGYCKVCWQVLANGRSWKDMLQHNLLAFLAMSQICMSRPVSRALK